MLRFVKVSIVFETGKRLIDEAEFTVRKGEFYTLSGASGSGKTTLLMCAVGEMKPTSGKVMLFGKDLYSLPRSKLAHLRRRIGFVFQDFRLLPERTVFENVAMPLVVQGANRRKILERTSSLLRTLGLSGLEDRMPPELSGGEQQRVAIARALVHEPVLLLADEPTGNLDPETSAKVIELFTDLNRKGATVILATHDEELRRALGKPSLIIENRKVVVR